MTRTPRACAAAVGLFALLALIAAPAAGADGRQQAPGAVRTDAGSLGGYTITGSAAPVVARFFEPVIPAPVDPGEPHLEASESYTLASLSTGPASRALASSMWPGPLVGEGLDTFVEGQSYPIKAEARDPQGPAEDAVELPGGPGMRASARGLDVLAEATTGRSPNPEAVRYGHAASTSAMTVEAGLARSQASSAVSDVALLGGLITIAEARTALAAFSDGVVAGTTGATQVAGVAIAGQGFVVDEQGARAVQDGASGQDGPTVPSSLPAADQLRELLGIEVELLPHTETIDGPDASRSAGGVRITIDTAAMRATLAALPVGALVEALPDDVAAEIDPVLQLAPKIVYILGRGTVRAAASQPLDVGAASAPEPPPPPDVPVEGPHEDGLAVPALDPLTGIAPPGAEAPAVALRAPAADASTSPARSGLPALFEGIPPAAVAVAVALTSLVGYGLSALTGRAFGAAGVCSRGAPLGVPDLRAGHGETWTSQPRPRATENRAAAPGGR